MPTNPKTKSNAKKKLSKSQRRRRNMQANTPKQQGDNNPIEVKNVAVDKTPVSKEDNVAVDKTPVSKEDNVAEENTSVKENNDTPEEVSVQEESDLPDNTDTDSSEEAGDIEDASTEVEETEEEIQAAKQADRDARLKKREASRIETFFNRYTKGMATNVSSKRNASSQLSLQKELYAVLKNAFTSNEWRKEVADLIKVMQSNVVFAPTLILRHYRNEFGKKQISEEFVALAVLTSTVAKVGLKATTKKIDADVLVSNITNPVIKQRVLEYLKN